jgi:hypothetical protein
MQIEEDHHQLVTKIIHQLSLNHEKSFTRIKRLIFDKENQAIITDFWRLLDKEVPNHRYQYIGINDCCDQFLLSVNSPYYH